MIASRSDVPERSNQHVRNKTKIVMREFGMRANSISRNTGVPYVDFTRWVNNKKNFNRENVEKIRKYIDQFDQLLMEKVKEE